VEEMKVKCCFKKSIPYQQTHVKGHKKGWKHSGYRFSDGQKQHTKTDPFLE
jgi:hypothetical protein